MKGIALVFAIGSVGLVNAESFELLTLIDYSNGRVIRYDPVNQVTLGSFGTGYLAAPYSISSVGNQSMVWDYGQQRMLVFNTSTGVLQRDFAGVGAPTGIMSELAIGGALSHNNGSTGSIFSRFDGTTVATLPFTVTNAYINVAENATHYYQFCAPLNQMKRFRKSDFANDLNWTNVNLGGGFLTFDTTMVNISGVNRMVLPDYFGNTIRFLNADTGSAYSSTISLLSSITGVAKGHGNILYLAGTGASRARVVRYNYITGFSSLVLDAPDTQYHFEGISSVVAPEPTSLLALTTGALWLLKRRKR